MKPIAQFVFALALHCNFAYGMFVEAPKDITLLPLGSNMVYFAIYNYEVLKDETIVFNKDNSCLDDLLHELQKALNQSGISFRKCYLLKDEDVQKFLNVVNETQNMEQFRKDNDKCLTRSSHFYEFNCYVKVVQEYLQKVYSYIHKPQNALQWNIEYQLALARYRPLTICTGGELKLLMEVFTTIQDAAAQCS